MSICPISDPPNTGTFYTMLNFRATLLSLLWALAPACSKMHCMSSGLKNVRNTDCTNVRMGTLLHSVSVAGRLHGG